MDNIELEAVIKAIIDNNNFFDMIEAALDFEPEYKKSNFYKRTKMPLMTMLEKSKVFYAINLNELFDKLQDKLDGLDLTHAMELINGIGNTFEKENDEIKESMETFKELNA